MVPKLWDETIAAHRREVTEAILENTARLVTQQGIRAVTMSQIAEETGIGRATLYKYFPDVETILLEWHEEQVSVHLKRLEEAGSGPARAVERLERVLVAYADIQQELGTAHATELGGLVHRQEHLSGAHRHLAGLIGDLIAKAAEAGTLRNDVSPQELAHFCVHSLQAARGLGSRAAVRRLIEVTLDGLRAHPA